MRKFYLFKSNTTNFHPLNGEESVWLSDPAGLGISVAPTLSDFGAGFFGITDDRREPRQDVTFTLSFTGADPYADYKTLIGWIESAEKLYLGYMPGSVLYKRRIIIKTVSKSELTKTRWLTCTVSAVCLEPWSREISLTMSSSAFSAPTVGVNGRWSDAIPLGGQLPMRCAYTFKANAARKIQSSSIVYQLAKWRDGFRGYEEGYSSVVVFDTPLELAAGEKLEVSLLPNDFYVDKVGTDGAITPLLDRVSTVYDPTRGLPPDAIPKSGTEIFLNINVDEIDSADVVAAKMYEYYRGV